MKEFTVLCTPDQYEEVAKILEGWGYSLIGSVWLIDEDCVITTYVGRYMTFQIDRVSGNNLIYTVEELRAMENPNN